MSMENKDNSTKSNGKSSPLSSEDAGLQHRPPSMNYPWYDDEGKLDAMIEALEKLPNREIRDKNQKS